MLDPAFLRNPLAHRTLHDTSAGRPENSLSGAQAAIDLGYGIEIDLQLSSDGQAMVFHDDELDRLTHQTGPLRDRTAAELSRITLRHGAEPIPSLRSFLDTVSGRVPLLIELKDQSGCLGPEDGALAADTADALKDYAGPVALMSFNPHSVAACHYHAPHITRGLTTETIDRANWPGATPERCAELTGIPDYDRLGCCFISHNHRHLDTPRVADLRAKGAAILCWTVRSDEEEAQARRIAHNITFETYLAAKSHS